MTKNCANEFDAMQQELVRMFDLLNEKFFDNAITEPVITIQSNAKSETMYGWSTPVSVWSKTGTEQEYYEITLCAEFMNRSERDIIATLMHEMVHVFNAQQNTKDTSRNDSYHNAKFRDAAEAHGLTVVKDDTYGYSITDLNSDAEEFVKANAVDNVFILSRMPDKDVKAAEDAEKPPRKPRKKKAEAETETLADDISGEEKSENSFESNVNVAAISAGLSNRSMDEAEAPSSLQNGYGMVGRALPRGGDSDSDVDDGGDAFAGGCCESTDRAEKKEAQREMQSFRCSSCGVGIMVDFGFKFKEHPLFCGECGGKLTNADR